MIARRLISVDSTGRGTFDITPEVETFVEASDISVGLCHIFVQHTSASLIVCENVDPSVREDLETFMLDIVTDGDHRFRHDQEGPDDMAAHIRSVITQTTITVPIDAGKCALGTWQGIYLWEHRTNSHHRRIMLTAYG